MPSGKLISNPNGAYGYTSIDQKLPQTTEEFLAGGTITAKVPVSITSTGTITATATDDTASRVVGISLKAITSGKTGLVITGGIASGVSAGGATTLGTPVIRSATTAGYVTSSASPAVGEAIGIALGASSSNQVSVYVSLGR